VLRIACVYALVFIIGAIVFVLLFDRPIIITAGGLLFFTVTVATLIVATALPPLAILGPFVSAGRLASVRMRVAAFFGLALLFLCVIWALPQILHFDRP
jgi:hypothetical protein